MPTPANTNRNWRFGVYEVDVRRAELRRSGTPVKLREQSFRILVYLLEHAGEIVTREELRGILWPSDTFVDFEHSLNTAVMKLREAIGDPADAPLYIETIPKRGYRFIAPVSQPGDIHTGLDSHAGSPSSVDATSETRQVAPVPAEVPVSVADSGDPPPWLYWFSSPELDWRCSFGPGTLGHQVETNTRRPYKLCRSRPRRVKLYSRLSRPMDARSHSFGMASNENTMTSMCNCLGPICRCASPTTKTVFSALPHGLPTVRKSPSAAAIQTTTESMSCLPSEARSAS